MRSFLFTFEYYEEDFNNLVQSQEENSNQNEKVKWIVIRNQFW